MKELFWETISHIYISEDNTYLAFFNNWCDKVFVYSTEGDCCSYTWFETITNPENMIGQKILGIEEKDMSDCCKDSAACDKCKDHEVVQVYGLTFKTQKGYTDIEYRNSSNGYYGGWCSYIPDPKIIWPLLDNEEYKVAMFVQRDLNYRTRVYPKFLSKYEALRLQRPVTLECHNSKITLYPYGQKSNIKANENVQEADIDE